jgi:hypothetical protein
MTRIDSSASLIARIQAQLRSAASLPPFQKEVAGKGLRRPTEASPDLTARVVQRVALIDKKDPDRERKALRIFFEAVLLNEFGPALAQDHRLHDMLDHIQSQFGTDPQLACAASEAAHQLLAGRP